MRRSEVQTVISPSAVDLPPTQSVDITDWIAAVNDAG